SAAPAAWLGAPGTHAVDWLLVAVNGLEPGNHVEARLPAGIAMEGGAGAHPDRALISGAAGALRGLEEAWAGAGGAERVASAVRQAVDAYLAPRARPPLVVGIVNVTPDSFSDGGAFSGAEAAVAHGLALAQEGAAWIDVGGESTRPGAAEVPPEEELRRVLPVVTELAQAIRVPISIDTRKASVAERCFRAGATILNDVSALTYDPEMARVAAEWGVSVVLMHMPGEPATMQQQTAYDDVVADTTRYLRERADAAVAAGIPADRLWVDPGF